LLILLTPPFICLSFFIDPSGDHRVLLSFPTRRSSDLPALMRFVLFTLAGSLPLLASIAAVCAANFRDPGLSGLPATIGHLSDTADRKSTRLNSSHVKISYAVFCLKKKTKQKSLAQSSP